jgi:hypothetical protein
VHIPWCLLSPGSPYVGKLATTSFSVSFQGSPYAGKPTDTSFYVFVNIGRFVGQNPIFEFTQNTLVNNYLAKWFFLLAIGFLRSPEKGREREREEAHEDEMGRDEKMRWA